jgi:hypothetical protein
MRKLERREFTKIEMSQLAGINSYIHTHTPRSTLLVFENEKETEDRCWCIDTADVVTREKQKE